MWTQQGHTDAQEKGNGTCLHATLPSEGQRLPAGPASPLCVSPAQAESAAFCCVCAPGLGRSKALPTPGSAGKVWVNRSKNGPSRDRTGPRFRSSLTTKDRLPESSCFLLAGVEGSASSNSRYPLLSRTGTARPRPGALGRGEGSTLRPSLHLPHPQLQATVAWTFEADLSLLAAQVYNDISQGGLFEDGCLESSHVFPSIHDAVLFAQAQAREVAPGHDFQEVRSLHLGNPRPWGTEVTGWFGSQHLFCQLTFLNLFSYLWNGCLNVTLSTSQDLSFVLVSGLTDSYIFCDT